MMYSRREFIVKGSVCITAAGVVAIVPNSLQKKFTSRQFLIVPLAGHTYSEGFKHFVEKARFDSPQEAVASVRNSKIPFRVMGA